MSKPKKPTKSQSALLDRVRAAGALCAQKVEGEPEFFLPGGKVVNAVAARNCIARGWLVPNQDGLFGDPQTYRAA